ncbi:MULTISPECIES: hypothetical protein [unclassified Enterococcus]|nr:MULTISPECIES: hypothetical protein [unclassified Enterococcus]
MYAQNAERTATKSEKNPWTELNKDRVRRLECLVMKIDENHLLE